MGTNTMVAAVGLVIGPVLGGALVAIAWPWVFWFNVPFALIGCAWGLLVLEERSGRSEERGLDLLGVTTYVIGLTGLVLALSKGGLTGWNNWLVIAGLAAAVVLPADLRADRAPRPRADARPRPLPRPALQRRVRRRVPERPLALRADVPVRLLLPGAAGAVADHGRARARADGDRDARRLAARGRLRRPARLARARRARDARRRDRARRHDDAAGAHRLRLERGLARRSSASARACSTARTRRR